MQVNELFDVKTKLATQGIQTVIREVLFKF